MLLALKDGDLRETNLDVNPNPAPVVTAMSFDKFEVTDADQQLIMSHPSPPRDRIDTSPRELREASKLAFMMASSEGSNDALLAVGACVVISRGTRGMQPVVLYHSRWMRDAVSPCFAWKGLTTLPQGS